MYGSSIFIQRLFQLGHEARDLPVARWILSVMLPVGFALLTLRFLELGWLFVKGSISQLGFGEQETPGKLATDDSTDQGNGS